MTEPLARVLSAKEPLTLAGVPTGFLPWLSADLSRAAHGKGTGARAVAIVADETAMRALRKFRCSLFLAGIAYLTTAPRRHFE
jgi:transcription-repair coupling factor (superfamily II helicase)